MRLKLITTLVLLSAPVLASNTPIPDPSSLRKKGALRFNPAIEDIRAVHLKRMTLQSQELTNPERLNTGVSPNSPRRRSPFSRSAARVEPSSNPGQFIIGFLHIRHASDGTSLGYVSSSFNSFGEYGPAASSEQRLEVMINESKTGPFSIATTNGPDADLPFMVGITGFANDASGLSPGKYNYVYVGAGNRTAVNVSPRSGDNSFSRATGNPEGIESTIFVLQSNLDVVPFWINGDGSKPDTFLGLYENVLFLTGDKNIFVETFGPVTWVILSFEPESN